MSSETITFPAEDGTPLAGRLDLPADGVEVIGHAIFAHCFTCSKTLHVVKRVATALNQHGIGVLRFDFTGLGESGGAFADSGFVRNIADLIAAAAFMEREGRPVGLLVGHSLGGAAVLNAAGELPAVKVVATIAAPADPAHVQHLFHADGFNDEGLADVSIGGRPFTISRQFVEQLEGHHTDERIAALRRPLLVFHSPTDQTVGIENAERIFKAAKHPKSFVSLGNADHLISRAEDAAYIGHVLGTWASFSLTTAAGGSEA
ncbi:MAG: alpha/beta hydrolase [Planctomycetota bacterium]